MTIGDQIREIKQESLRREIRELKRKVHSILEMDGDASESDPEIQAYRRVIAEKEREYENL